ncbi:hypothetical protein BBJ29_004259 [Phytophthora kernoviae]|uniref:Neutral zinc metallopeptidase n=1 Tax=Phytophthora kernoviae TaxID=325452 RepID=A0A421G6N0_9STRA|nr:hypothetical protein BBJ29_004259 [Phytophthora kernoviae]
MDHIVHNNGTLNYCVRWDSTDKLSKSMASKFQDALTRHGWSDTSACKSEPFDVFLQPKKGLDGGFGYDYGQAVNQEDMLANIDGDQLTIIAHEIGHGFGLPDFYEANEQPGTDFPNCLMKAGSSMTVTDSDGWMLRRVLEHLKPRYNF